MQKSLALTRAFQALADPTRRSILEQLAQEERTVMELADRFTISQPAVTKHLKVLETAGLISRRKAGRHRICRVEPAGLSQAAGWIATWSGHWNTRLDELEQFLSRPERKRS